MLWFAANPTAPWEGGGERGEGGGSKQEAEEEGFRPREWAVGRTGQAQAGVTAVGRFPGAATFREFVLTSVRLCRVPSVTGLTGYTRACVRVSGDLCVWPFLPRAWI